MKVEAQDHATGATYYYNETTGKSQWERPNEASLCVQSPSPSPSSSSVPLPANWVEALDETSGANVQYKQKHSLLHLFFLKQFSLFYACKMIEFSYKTLDKPKY